MRHYLAPLLTLTMMAAAIAGAALVHEIRPARAAAPTQILHARISVPPAPAPASLTMREGFNGIANPEPGVYHVLLESGEFGATSALMCAGTKPGVTCAVDILEPVAGQPYTNLVVYRERWGQPENGDVWIWALL